MSRVNRQIRSARERWLEPPDSVRCPGCGKWDYLCECEEEDGRAEQETEEAEGSPE